MRMRTIIGAVVHLWRQFRCKVYATPFAAAVLTPQADRSRAWSHEVPLVVTQPRARFTLGPFDLQYLPVAHSIPEAQALVLRTRHGTVLHTGDWKLDPDPLIGPAHR